MLDGILLLWVILTILSVVYVAYDLIVNTPEPVVMKIGWVLVVLYTGPLGLFFFLLSCRQPMPSTHEQFVKPQWKQSLGSEVHCLAGDATGIIIAALILSFYNLTPAGEVAIEYAAGFISGLLIFQALFMRKMMGGSYIQSIKSTFYPEWLSMNTIMAGMIPVMIIWGKYDPLSQDALTLHFWGKMSLATIVGGFLAYPMNWYLVAKRLKHGMTTVVKEESEMKKMDHKEAKVSKSQIFMALFISLISLSLGILVSIVW